MPRALVVEDEANSRKGLEEWLGEAGFETDACATLEAAKALLATRSFDVALLDLQLPDGKGIELVRELQNHPDCEIVIITGHGTIDSAVEALREGAVDYLTKPVDLQRLQRILDGVARTLDLRREITALRDEQRELGRFGTLLGASPAMQKVYDMIARVSPTTSTVLISGETGSGKELVARMVHRLSRRARLPFIAINCGAIPGSLLESELFGHEKGSFTGADKARRGIFEQADGGTLLLDEITEMPMDLQVKLLRVLEARTFTRIGGEDERKIDVRLLAATNKDPGGAVEQGKLRQDLLYRLNVFPITVPALRERGVDLELLAQHFLARLNRENGTAKRLTEGALEKLRRHTWPGNVRELKNVIERAYIIAGDRVDEASVPLDDVARIGAGAGSGELRPAVGMPISEAERHLILATLEHLGGDKKRAAEMLGISLKTLYNRLKAYAN